MTTARILAFALALALNVGSAVAQSYPSKTVHLIVPYPAGGGYDRLARLIGPKLSDRIGQPVIVENRPGAGGTLAMAHVASQPADGHTLVVAGAGDITINPFLYTRLPYDVRRDFAPITMLATFTLLLTVNPKLQVNSVRELIDLARKQPGRLTYASSSPGSTGHISSEMLKSMAGVNIVHVPYKGTSPALNDLIGGHVDMMITDIGTQLPQVQDGRIRALGVTTEVRDKILPDVPTIEESGLPGYEVTGWWGLFAPARTPDAVVSRLNREVLDILALRDIQDSIAVLGGASRGMSVDQFKTRINADIGKFEKIVKGLGLKLD